MPEDNRSKPLGISVRGLLVAWMLLAPQQVLAEQPMIVATAPFDGRELARPPKKPIEPGFTASVVYEALTERSAGRPYRLLAPDLWTGMARLKNQGKTGDLLGMAKLLGARLIVAGYLEATSGSDHPKPYRLHVSVYAADGALLGQLSFDVDRPLLKPATFADKGSAIQLLIEQSLPRAVVPNQPAVVPNQPAVVLTPQVVPNQPAASPSAVVPTKVVASTLPQRRGQVEQLEDSEQVQFDPRKPKTSLVPLSAEAQDLLQRRPPWQAALQLELGYLYNTRLLQNEGSELRFGRSGAHGMVILGELYPLALLPASGPLLSGIGLRAQVLLPFWPDIAHVLQPGQPQSGSYAASELRYDIALRGHWNPWNQVLRPDIAIEALYGEHSFQTSAKQNIDYLRVPPSNYRYLGGALAVRLFFTQRVSVTAGATLAKHLSLGLLTRPGTEGGSMAEARDRNGFLSYGPGDGWQWRLEGSSQVNVYRGLTLGARLFFEQNRLRFDGGGNILQSSGQPVTTATDDYLGVMATIGYTYQPRLVR